MTFLEGATESGHVARVRIISLGRAVVRVRAVVLVRDRKGVGGTATARFGRRVEVLKSGRRRVKVRVLGSDLCNIDKEVWRSLSAMQFVRKASRPLRCARLALFRRGRTRNERVM